VVAQKFNDFQKSYLTILKRATTRDCPYIKRRLTMTKTPQENLQPREPLPEEAIIEYLQQHPEFLTHHADLLDITFPPAGDATVSLIKQKITLLRDKNQQLRKENQQWQRKWDDLVVVAQENEQLNERIRRLIVALISVTEIDDFFHTLYSTLCNEFNTDTVVVRCFEVPGSTNERQEFVEYDAQVFTLFDSVLENHQPLCGQLATEQLDYLFPNSKIASAALIPLSTHKSRGLLAMGSQDASRFHTDMATDFLKYLGEVLSQLLRIWVY